MLVATPNGVTNILLERTVWTAFFSWNNVIEYLICELKNFVLYSPNNRIIKACICIVRTDYVGNLILFSINKKTLPGAGSGVNQDILVKEYKLPLIRWVSSELSNGWIGKIIVVI